MKQTTNRIAPFLPWLGLLLLAAGAVVTLITRRFDLLNNLLLGLGALCLFLFAVLRPDDVRRLFSGRQARYGSSTGLAILFFLAITIVVYWIAYQNQDWRWDTTETNEFTPLPETVALLDGLDEPVHVIGFYTQQLALQEAEAQSILESLQAENNLLTYEFQDPEVNPVLAQQYDLNFNGTLVFTKGDDFAKANSLVDRDIHSALLQVINPTDKVLYFVSGHGERSIEDFAEQGVATAIGFVEDLGFAVKELPLIISGTVPADATAVVLLNPQAPLAPQEVQALRDYTNSGGSAFIALDVPQLDQEGNLVPGDENLAAFLREDWGIEARQDIIVEVIQALAGQTLGLSFAAADYGRQSPIITEDLLSFNTVYFQARSISSFETDRLSHLQLVMTSDDAWGETNFTALVEGNVQSDPEDAPGPLSVAVTVQHVDTAARLVVFGDSDFITNQGIQGGNRELFSNALNWLANDEISIELTPRETVNRQVVIPQEQASLLQLISVLLAPVLMAVVGTFVWYSRRS